MRNVHVRLWAIGAIAVLNTGCATITRGTTEVLVIETTPAGADVELSTGARCKSPCSMEMKRKNAVVVDITKDGYEPVRVNVLSQVAGAGAAGMAGNVVFGGIIGAGVDAATGATKQLKPNPVVVTLVPKAANVQAPAAAGNDGVLEMARARCEGIGYKSGTDEFRGCLTEQIRNISGTN